MAEVEKTWTPQEIGTQLRKPEGDGGLLVAENMQLANVSLYNVILTQMGDLKAPNLLEIGFGNGAHFQRYYGAFPSANITGVDFSQTMCDAAAELNPTAISNGSLTLHCGDALHINAAINTFDIAVAVNTLYFWQPLLDYLKEIHRVLKPGGQLMLGYRPKETMDKLPFTEFGFQKYEPAEIENLLLQAGFASVHQTSNTFMRIPVLGEDIENTDIVAVALRG